MASGVEDASWFVSDDASRAETVGKRALPVAIELAVDVWCEMHPGVLGAKEANALETAALLMALDTSEILSKQHHATKERRRTFHMKHRLEAARQKTLSTGGAAPRRRPQTPT